MRGGFFAGAAGAATASDSAATAATLLRGDVAYLGVGERSEQRLEPGGEHGVRRARGAPDRVEAAQRLVDDRRQRRVVAEWRGAPARAAPRPPPPPGPLRARAHPPTLPAAAG